MVNFPQISNKSYIKLELNQVPKKKKKDPVKQLINKYELNFTYFKYDLSYKL